MRPLFAVLLLLTLPSCALDNMREERTGESDPTLKERYRMVTDQLVARGISDPAVLDAMRRVPRHMFVPEDRRKSSYEDRPVPIGYGQTISQPYIVAYMTQALDAQPGEKILEIGTGSGYQAAVLAEIVKEVYSIEIVPELAKRAQAVLETLGYENVHTREGDGYRGWPEEAPFDGILVTAAPDHIPQPLIDQLAVNGRLIIPVGDWNQEIVIVTRTNEGVLEQRTIPVRFVPMTGESTRRNQN